MPNVETDVETKKILEAQTMNNKTDVETSNIDKTTPNELEMNYGIKNVSVEIDSVDSMLATTSAQVS